MLLALSNFLPQHFVYVPLELTEIYILMLDIVVGDLIKFPGK